VFPNEHLVHTELHVQLILVIMPVFVHVLFPVVREIIDLSSPCLRVHTLGTSFVPIAPRLHECKFQSLCRHVKGIVCMAACPCAHAIVCLFVP
jgi:hypothetical protein